MSSIPQKIVVFFPHFLVSFQSVDGKNASVRYSFTSSTLSCKNIHEEILSDWFLFFYFSFSFSPIYETCSCWLHIPAGNRKQQEVRVPKPQIWSSLIWLETSCWQGFPFGRWRSSLRSLPGSVLCAASWRRLSPQRPAPKSSPHLGSGRPLCSGVWWTARSAAAPLSRLSAGWIFGCSGREWRRRSSWSSRSWRRTQWGCWSCWKTPPPERWQWSCWEWLRRISSPSHLDISTPKEGS